MEVLGGETNKRRICFYRIGTGFSSSCIKNTGHLVERYMQISMVHQHSLVEMGEKLMISRLSRLAFAKLLSK